MITILEISRGLEVTVAKFDSVEDTKGYNLETDYVPLDGEGIKVDASQDHFIRILIDKGAICEEER